MPVGLGPLKRPEIITVPPNGFGPPPAMVPRRFATPLVLLRLLAEPLLGSGADVIDPSFLKLPAGSDGTLGGALGVLGMAAGAAPSARPS